MGWEQYQFRQVSPESVHLRSRCTKRLHSDLKYLVFVRTLGKMSFMPESLMASAVQPA